MGECLICLSKSAFLCCGCGSPISCLAPEGHGPLASTHAHTGALYNPMAHPAERPHSLQAQALASRLQGRKELGCLLGSYLPSAHSVWHVTRVSEYCLDKLVHPR